MKTFADGEGEGGRTEELLARGARRENGLGDLEYYVVVGKSIQYKICLLMIKRKGYYVVVGKSGATGTT